MTTFKFDKRQLTALILAAGLFSAVSGPKAHAQGIAAVVDGVPITTLEVSERRAFIRLTQKKNETPRQVTDSLIDEALIMKEAGRRNVTVNEGDVDGRFAQVASSVKLQPAQLTQVLSQNGASARTFKASIRAQLAFRRLVTGRFNPAQISEKAIARELDDKKSDTKGFRLTLRQIIFVLPKNANAGQVATRRREAEALRARFRGCESGLELARGMRDVAVKDPIVRTSGQLTKPMRDAFARIKVGETSKPERGEQGVEIIAVCARNDINDDAGLRQQVQMELADEQMQGEGKKYLSDLRQRASIQYR